MGGGGEVIGDEVRVRQGRTTYISRCCWCYGLLDGRFCFPACAGCCLGGIAEELAGPAN